MIQGSRFLNEKQGIFGIEVNDLMGATIVFLVVSGVLQGTGYELLAFGIAIGLLMALVPVRLSYRRRIIRDVVGFFLLPKRVYVPKAISRT